MDKILDNEIQIISIGNELLTGKTLNTNLNWISKRLTSIGAKVLHAFIVRDNLEAISNVLNYALSKRTSWIIISGGLGPTFDDMTLDGVALALKRNSVQNEDALKMMQVKYDQMIRLGIIENFELTDERKKMISLPEGATPIENITGTAPAVYLKVKDTVIICLPGVPSEMQNIVDQTVIPMIREIIGDYYFAEGLLRIGKIIESNLAPLIADVSSMFPKVYIKSHPRGAELGESKIELEITVTTGSKDRSRKLVNGAIVEMEKRITNAGGEIIYREILYD